MRPAASPRKMNQMSCTGLENCTPDRVPKIGLNP